MSDITQTAEIPKKRRGMPKGGWPKKEQPEVEVVREKLPEAMQGEALAKFVYQATPGELDDWEHNAEVSPMHVPKTIQNKYPDLAFRYVSRQKWDKFGKNYHGWQTFQDSEHPQGVTRGNDMFLCAMPKERAQRYRDSVSEKSNANIRARQQSALELHLSQNISQEEMEKMGIPAGAEAGIVVGVRPRTKLKFGGRVVIGGGGTRGMSREEAREVARKEIEDRKKNRVYSFAK
jgi:hypothetical protein